jgi:hypothetical protein
MLQFWDITLQVSKKGVTLTRKGSEALKKAYDLVDEMKRREIKIDITLICPSCGRKIEVTVPWAMLKKERRLHSHH